MQDYAPVGAYGGSFPIRRAPHPSPFLVGGEIYGARGELLAVDIHFDGDDQNHTFLDAEEWEPLPGAASLARDYNAPHKKTFRLRLARMTTFVGDIGLIIERAGRAEALLEFARKARAGAAPKDAVEDLSRALIDGRI